MKRVKFISDDPRQKEFNIVVRKKVNNYFKEKGISTKGNSAMFIKAIIWMISQLLSLEVQEP